MSEFEAYLKLGFAHITDLNGYDHILFVLALCAIYQLNEWRKIMILVTAFTIGHTVTLALATLNLIHYKTETTELLISITIVLTALSNYFQKPSGEVKTGSLRYVFALFFGLIHGLGFSTYLRSLLGSAENILLPLFSFNVGLELGQLLIVAVGVLIASFFVNILKIKRFTWNNLVSGIVAGMALTLILQKIGF